jgi:hypothetical protein
MGCGLKNIFLYTDVYNPTEAQTAQQPSKTPLQTSTSTISLTVVAGFLRRLLNLENPAQQPEKMLKPPNKHL